MNYDECLIGQRIGFLGLDEKRNGVKKIGTIISLILERQVVRVKWDMQKAPSNVSPRFIILIKQSEEK